MGSLEREQQQRIAREALLLSGHGVEDAGPEYLLIVEATPPGEAPALFAVVADHGWAEQIVATDLHEDAAVAVANALAAACDAEVKRGGCAPAIEQELLERKR